MRLLTRTLTAAAQNGQCPLVAGTFYLWLLSTMNAPRSGA
jgi:hypothetical protein